MQSLQVYSDLKQCSGSVIKTIKIVDCIFQDFDDNLSKIKHQTIQQLYESFKRMKFSKQSLACRDKHLSSCNQDWPVTRPDRPMRQKNLMIEL